MVLCRFTKTARQEDGPLAWHGIDRGSALARCWIKRHAAVMALMATTGLLHPCMVQSQRRPAGSDTAGRHVSRGNALLDNQQVDAAIEEFNAAIRLNPKLAAAYD